MKKIELNIKGMTCAACSARIERKLSRLNGVINVSVNLPLNKGTVEYDDSKLNLDKIISTINSLGFAALLPENEVKVNPDEKEKKLLHKVIFSAILASPLILGMFLHIFHLDIAKYFMNPFVQFLLATPVQFFAGYTFYKGAYHNLKSGGANMDTLVALGTTAAYIYSVYNMFTGGDLYFETSTMLITLVLLGKYFEARATKKASDAINKLLKLTPKTAKVEKDGYIIIKDIKDILPEEILIIATGDTIPLDGVILNGEGYIDESYITGESIPVTKKPGDQVLAGTINISKSFKMVAKVKEEDTLLSQIIKIVEQAQTSKAPIQKFADKVSAYFVPSVILISIITFISWYLIKSNFYESIMASIAVLVISCPCALGLATPTSIMVASGIGAKNGILFKTSEAMENLGRIDTIIFDKTGTLTKGDLTVLSFKNLSQYTDEELLSCCYFLEKYSSHPIARAITQYSEKFYSGIEVDNVEEIAGVGIRGFYNGQELFIGKIIDKKGIPQEADVGIYINTIMVGYFVISDIIRDESQETIGKLKQLGLKIYMLTGDKKDVAIKIGNEIGIDLDHIYYEVLPTEKAYYVRKIKSNSTLVTMVGDGINDAPALSVADISIAMGSGTDIAIDVADVILMKDDLKMIYNAILLSRKTLLNIKQNLFWAFFYNIIGIPVAALGMLNPIVAGAAMSFSSVSVVTNALRLKHMYYKTIKKQ
ncbi:MAG: cadmium-translocating P-type ATPase [Deferribacterales bacterium]